MASLNSEQRAKAVGHFYKITRKSTGEYYYGIHKGVEQNGYWGSGVRITNYLKTHTPEDLEYQILVIGSYNYIINVEEKFVTKEEIKNDLCWNCKSGGYRGIPGEETRKKISEKGLGRIVSKETIIRRTITRSMKKAEIGAKISKSNTGRPCSKEKAKKISISRILGMNDEKRKNYSNAFKGIKNNAWKGYVNTHIGIFESSQAAAKYFGCTDKTVLNRIRSNSNQFSSWFRMQTLPSNKNVIPV